MTNLSQWLRQAVDFAFPACTGLSRLPSYAPTWQRAAISDLAVLEIGSLFVPPSKADLILGEKSIYKSLHP